MALESAIFRQKFPCIFSDSNPSNFIICKFKHFKKPFSLQNSKTTYSVPFKPISTVFHFLIKLVSIGLNKIPTFALNMYPHKENPDDFPTPGQGRREGG